ncbi:MAG: CPXCG motif-containing cysteine-rich protein [Candidatus Obscuribacterales bacterium]|nr:CPXCG motif-containing cysteine-rich protein [Candidatus Obscuribacterales bacterium]
MLARNLANHKLLGDYSAGSQSYIEDCQVCCNPIAVSYCLEDGEMTSFTADASQ